MRVYMCLYDHPVYQALWQTLSRVDGIETVRLKDPSRYLPVFYVGKSFQLLRLNLRLSRKHIYALNSPLVCTGAWDALFHNVPAFIVEEHLGKSRRKNFLVNLALLPFRRYPFISFTKRTHAFLSKRSLCSFLFPPAERKRSGSKNRDFLLFVGAMLETKKPLFVLELARRLSGEHFVLIGRGPLLPEVRKRANALPNVEIIEYVEQRETLLRDYYPKAKALLHPASKDPVGFVVVEALACSTPVLAGVGAGASDYLPEPWRVAGYDVTEWTRKIESLGSDDVHIAEKTFEQENLNIESPYFEEAAKHISTFLKERGWL
jgi:glycosyltransferase involved in cell wall biosynthesis